MTNDDKDTFYLNLQLTREEFDALILVLGIATGQAFKTGMKKHAYMLLSLANAVNKDNPNWRPYDIPPEFAHGSEVADNPNPQSDGDKPHGRGKRKPGAALQ
jgi:hypothetical protein